MHPPVVIGGVVLLGVALSPALPAPPVLAGLIACALAARLHRGLLVPAALLLGALVAVGLPEGPALTGPVVVQGTVAAAPTGRQADLDVWACAVDGGPFAPCGGRVRVVFETPPSPGSSWVVSGRAGPPDADGLGGPQPALGMERARIRTLIRASRARRIGGDLPDTPVAEGPLGLLAAVARGDRRGVDPDSWRILRDTGTAHLLAISGFHVGVVAGA
ncbi:MAG: ComEC/Rec2 family competence protein, partial [Myxococcales bacterium]|nr:ComEC/Rec2 family competence protein [Myxococcales bacterium]